MAIELRYRVVDVFSDRPLAGNAVCVVLDPCPEPVMGAIAREVNLSETTFPTVIGDDEYEVRIFTPSVELPFAGHPSLGTAWALGPGRWTQVSEGATVEVEADGDGAVMTQPTPVITEVDDKPVADAVQLDDVEAVYRADAGGVAHLLLPTASRVDRLGVSPPMLADLAARARVTTVAVFCLIDDSTLKARVFVPSPSGGGFEDPGTGSAAGPIALLARRLWGTAADVVIEQGDEIGRPCRIEALAEEDDVRVGGRVAACAEGLFTL